MTLEPGQTGSYVFTLDVLSGTDVTTLLDYPTVITTSIPGDMIENNTSTDTVTLLGHVPYCGDGEVNGYYSLPIVEACDDGNTIDNDGCSSTCQLETCGDGIVQTAEACEIVDGETIRNTALEIPVGAYCTPICSLAQRPTGVSSTPKTYCGDGIVQSPNDSGVLEQCDGAQ